MEYVVFQVRVFDGLVSGVNFSLDPLYFCGAADLFKRGGWYPMGGVGRRIDLSASHVCGLSVGMKV